MITYEDGTPVTPPAAPEPQTTIAALNLHIQSVFVPWSKSRSFKKGAPLQERNLNWCVTLWHGQRALLACDYSAGIAHAPAYKRRNEVGRGNLTVDGAAALSFEVEHGREARGGVNTPGLYGGPPILPDPVDVLASLVMDASVIDCASFEEWASEIGYDTESRKAESMYRECLSTALKLRAALGDDGLQRLREAFQDY